jgi:hypothetical protein
VLIFRLNEGTVNAASVVPVINTIEPKLFSVYTNLLKGSFGKLNVPVLVWLRLKKQFLYAEQQNLIRV